MPVSTKASNKVIKKRKEIENSLNKDVKAKINQLIRKMNEIGESISKVIENADSINSNKNHEMKKKVI